MNEELLAVLLMVLAAVATGAGMWLMATVFGPHSRSAAKDAPFECGNPSYGTQGKRYSIKYFMVALLFLVFDLEVVFLYPWAVLFQKLGVEGFFEMLVFLGVLLVGLAYVWKKGALEWE